ncbi:hypothetical protein H1D32_02455 [Anaerobacillus sp. CMMVII]|uniref:hypothetical protein n=1 Tax=Anaerobacillus sp. CMMVII TaxID=2755588 RepID=UPI0021B7A5F1|nr:hypothetical protein [Anaerobacillus sp. CMMVII]MCT8136711.1 hypothetical protein [Anaerobacillus sp. CMMVII]
MKKFSSLVVFVLVLLVAVGCASGEVDNKSEISFEEIVTDIKAQMSEDLKEQTNGDVTDVSQVYLKWI